ncbi:LysR family transcriptional regulator [Zavarzinia compransoris]|uniref:LysR substrate-binding domain-containing protein n=1 Tax=Zavarzinia marina TaxID=2911065 RepID=UPI001F4191F4|nr:LysR substrate-binding domain-containing protein [Zavarzinia marina]MCF4166240.1 LysR family transcriptional regulator [Zavarzinia marina]
MSSPLPASRIPVPLNALRAFEAVARHLSIRDAAAELAVTPSAVSHQLRGLEEALGMDLLRRAGNRLELTDAGARLAPELADGFGRIAQAVGALGAGRGKGPLRLSMLPTFAVHWLSPRLIRYPFERQGFELLISTTQATVDLGGGEADAAIRHGAGAWPGLRADLLFEETADLFAGPAPVAVEGANLFLSQHRRDLFAAWNATLPGGPLRPASVTTVESTGLALRAAADGAGIAFAGVEMAAADVAAGRLRSLCHRPIAAGGGYWLVYPDRLKGDRRLANVRRWLLAEAATSRPG